jgi:DNA-binding transcriptional regulator YdaS (Cro superfamily)
MEGMSESISSSPESEGSALDQAVKVAGGRTALMRKLNDRGWDIKSHAVIWQWGVSGVPAKYCPDIEDLTGVPCEALCPDVKWGLVRDRRAKKRKS